VPWQMPGTATEGNVTALPSLAYFAYSANRAESQALIWPAALGEGMPPPRAPLATLTLSCRGPICLAILLFLLGGYLP
jgi:hypothetical protein